MARPNKTVRLKETTVIDASGVDAVQKGNEVQEGFPLGDNAITQLRVHYDGVIGVSGGSNPVKVTDGEKKFLRGLWLETDKHGYIINGLDGIMLNRILTYEWGKAPVAVGVSATPTDADVFSHGMNIPLILPNGFRAFDTILDLLKQKPKITTLYGIRSDIFGYTGGSPVVKSLTEAINIKYLPGPLNRARDSQGNRVEGNEEAELFRSLERSIWPIAQTQNEYQIPLPWNDRTWRRIFVTQRNGSDLSELATVITKTAKVSLVAGGVTIFDRVRFGDLQEANVAEYQVDSPTGVGIIDFDADMREKINDLLGGPSKDQGNLYLYVDATAVSNGQIWLGLDSLKPPKSE